jgi:uncharacterized protein (TIGR03083 family)
VAPPADHPADFARLFESERERLLSLLASVADDEWALPSPCPGWSVLGLCAHLVGDDLGLLARNRDGYLGTRPPDGLDEAGFIAWLDDMQAEWVRAARRLSPPLVVDLLRWAGPQLVDVLGRQDPRAPTGHVTWAGPDPVPAWLDHGRELSEYWIHRQQLLQALGRPSDLRPDLLAPVLDVLRWAYPYRLEAVAARAGDSATVEVHGPVTATWHLVSDGTAWDFRLEAGARQVARLTMTTEQAWRLLTNNLPPDAQAQLDVAGDGAVTRALLRTRAIIGTPK